MNVDLSQIGSAIAGSQLPQGAGYGGSQTISQQLQGMVADRVLNGSSAGGGDIIEVGIRSGITLGGTAAAGLLGIPPTISLPISSIVADIASKPLRNALNVVVNKITSLF